jgi:phosphatidate cytidylyltransferase
MKLAVLRVFTGFMVAGVTITCVNLGSYGFLFYILVLNFLGLMEFYRLFRSAILLPRALPGFISSAVFIFSLFFVVNGIMDMRILLVNIPFAFSIFVMELYGKAKNPFLNIAITFLGIIWISVPLGLFLIIAFLPVASVIYHPEIIIGLFVILWAGDSGAFFSGKMFGKNHLFHRISPNKTWEGSLGGSLSSLSVAYIISLIDHAHHLQEWIFMALIIIIAGTFGDLIKSLMKRSLHVKDAGTILPGHGGILDRFDTLLGSAPFLFGYLILSGNG